MRSVAKVSLSGVYSTKHGEVVVKDGIQAELDYMVGYYECKIKGIDGFGYGNCASDAMVNLVNDLVESGLSYKKLLDDEMVDNRTKNMAKRKIGAIKKVFEH